MSTPGYADRMPKSHEQDWASEAEQRVLDAALPLVSQVGWNAALVARAGQGCRAVACRSGAAAIPKARAISPPSCRAVTTRRRWTAFAKIDPSKLKVRERIHAAVEARIDAAMTRTSPPSTPSSPGWPVRRTPPLGLTLGWETADALWRWAGDTATDENHYSKRAILGTVLATTLGRAAERRGTRRRASTSPPASIR